MWLKLWDGVNARSECHAAMSKRVFAYAGYAEVRGEYCVGYGLVRDELERIAAAVGPGEFDKRSGVDLVVERVLTLVRKAFATGRSVSGRTVDVDGAVRWARKRLQEHGQLVGVPAAERSTAERGGHGG